MEHYRLREDEVVLYKGRVYLCKKKGVTDLILTNLHIVFVNKYKKLFSQEEITVYDYSIEDIKMYNGVPQIKTKNGITEVYLLDTEIEFRFESKKELILFVNTVNKLLTGESTIQKKAKEVRNAIDLVDETLGIDTVKATGNVLKNGVIGSIASSVSKVFGKNKKS